MSRTAIDLFCGAAAGWTLGLHWAGVRVSTAAEADPVRRAAYNERWAPIYVHEDVRLMGKQNCSSPWLLAGSPPCKGISEVNHKGKGVDDDGLFFEAIRLAAELRARRWTRLART
jgi:site-specific DNA-cytosine methylase